MRFRITGQLLGDGGGLHGLLEVEGGRIVAATGVEGPTIDLDGLYVAAGLIDLQINGAYGEDFTTRPEGMWDVGRRLPATGVTAFCPTIISAPLETYQSAVDALAAGPPAGYRGAQPLGLHFEGPMLSPARAGAHPPEHLRPPSPDLVAGWSPDNGVVLVTLAPEIEGAEDVVKTISARGTVVSLGHSQADAAQGEAALGWGARAGTHLFNAMSGVDHRHPGLATALLTETDALVGLIVDGLHVHPAAVRLAWEMKGPDHLILVTDAIAALGLGEGVFSLGSVKVQLGADGPRHPNGGLAGSVLTLDQAVRNLASYTGAGIGQAIRSATSTPASLLGDPRRGHLRPGARADLAILDERMEVVATLVGGEPVYDPQELFAVEEESR